MPGYDPSINEDYVINLEFDSLLNNDLTDVHKGIIEKIAEILRGENLMLSEEERKELRLEPLKSVLNLDKNPAVHNRIIVSLAISAYTRLIEDMRANAEQFERISQIQINDVVFNGGVQARKEEVQALSDRIAMCEEVLVKLNTSDINIREITGILGDYKRYRQETNLDKDLLEELEVVAGSQISLSKARINAIDERIAAIVRDEAIDVLPGDAIDAPDVSDSDGASPVFSEEVDDELNRMYGELHEPVTNEDQLPGVHREAQILVSKLTLMLQIVKNFIEIEDEMELLGIQLEANIKYQKIYDYLDLRKQLLESHLQLGSVDLDSVMRGIGEFRAKFEEEFKTIDYKLERLERGVEVAIDISSANMSWQSLEELLAELSSSSTATPTGGVQSRLSEDMYEKSKQQLIYLVDQDILYLNKIELYMRSDSANEVRKLLDGIYDINKKYFIQKNYQPKTPEEAVKVGDLKSRQQALEKELVRAGIIAPDNKNAESSKFERDNQIKKLTAHIVAFEACLKHAYSKSANFEEDKANLRKIYQDLCRDRKAMLDSGFDEKQKSVIARAERIMREYDQVNFSNKRDLYAKHLLIGRTKINMQHFENLKMILDFNDSQNEKILSLAANRYPDKLKMARDLLVLNVRDLTALSVSLKAGDFKHYIDGYLVDVKKSLDDYNDYTKRYADRITDNLEGIINELRGYLSDKDRNHAYTRQFKTDIELLHSIIMKHRSNHYLNFDQHGEVKRIAESIKYAAQNLEKYKQLQNLASRLSSQAQEGIKEEVKYLTPDVADQSQQQQAILRGAVQEAKEKKASIDDELKQEISKIQGVEVSFETKQALETLSSAVMTKLSDSRERVSVIPGSNRLNQQYSNIEMLLVRMSATFEGASKWGLIGHDDITKLSTEMDDVVKIIDLLRMNGFKSNVDIPDVDVALYGEIKNIMKRVNLYRVDQDHLNTIDAHHNKLLIFEEFLKSRNAKVAQKVKSAKLKLEKDLSEKKYGKLEATREQVLPKLDVSEEQKPFQFKAPEAANEAYHQVLKEMTAISQYKLDESIEPGLDGKVERLEELVSWLPKIKSHAVAVADLLNLIERDLTSDMSDFNKGRLLALKEILDNHARFGFADPIVINSIGIIIDEYAATIQLELITAKDDDDPLVYIAKFNRLPDAVNTLSPESSSLVLASLQPLIEEHLNNPIIREGVHQKDIRNRLNEIINIDRTKFLSYINQWANFETKKGEYKGRYDDISATFESVYSAEKKGHDKFVELMNRRIDNVVERAVQIKAVLDGNGEVDPMFHLYIEELFLDMQYLNDDITHFSQFHKEVMEKADLGPESSRRSLSDFAVSLNGLIQKIPMQELNQLKSQIEIEREYVSLLSSASDDLNLTADIFNNVSTSKQFHNKFMANASTLSPAYYFAPQQFNQSTLATIKANRSAQVQLAYYLQQIPAEFWRENQVNVESVMDRLSDGKPLLNEILKIVDLTGYQQSIASSDKVYQAINEIDDTYQKTDLTQYIVDSFVNKLKDADGVVDVVTVMELEIFLNSIPEDCYKTDKEGTIENILERANEGKLDAKLLASRFHPKKYSDHLFQLIDTQLRAVTDLSLLKLTSCRSHLSELEDRIVKIPALQASVDGRQLLAEVSEQHELLRYHVKINTYATTPQSLQAMSEALTKIQLKISELSTRVEDYLQTHRSLVSQQAITPPKPSKKLAQTIMLEGMLQMRTPETNPKKGATHLEDQPLPSVTTSLQSTRQVTTNDPVILHLLKWGDKDPSLGRAFMVSSTGSDPSIDPALKSLLKSDAAKLFELLNRSITDDTQIMQLNHDIHQFFVECATRINTGLNAHPQFQDRDLVYKKDICNAYISAVKHGLLELVPTNMEQIKLYSRLVDRYTLKPDASSMQSSTRSLESFVPIVDNVEIKKFKDSQVMHHLIDMVKQMEVDYKTLNKTNHSKELQRLNAKLSDSLMTPEKAIQLVQAEFERQRQSAKSLFGISFSRQSFAEVINKNKNHYHYPRMLALALETVYRENALHIPKSQQKSRLTSMVVVPDETQYQKYKPKEQASSVVARNTSNPLAK